MEMKWTVGANPQPSGAFFSPWFGMDPADNMNLIQPVNPWMGSSWSAYTEYYQWSDGYNSNSHSINVLAGQTLHGTLTYMPSSDSYNLTQTVVETGANSQQVVACQDGKKYNLPYVVYEKVFPCYAYPPDQFVLFRDIKIECDNADCTNSVQWKPMVKDANCDMQAHINSNGTISITWDTSAQSKYDDKSPQELFDINYNGWATKIPSLKRPAVPEGSIEQK